VGDAQLRVSWATPSVSSVSAALRRVDQSDWLPMMMPTRGASSPIQAPRPQPALPSGAAPGHYRGKAEATQAGRGPIVNDSLTKRA
jgi:hypothetical protein